MNPNDLLFAIAHGSNNLGNNNFTVDVDSTVRNNSTTSSYMSANVPQQLARFIMGRYWNVNVTADRIVDPVWGRFYYQGAEKQCYKMLKLLFIMD